MLLRRAEAGFRAVAIDGFLRQDFLGKHGRRGFAGIAALDKEADRAAQGVIFSAIDIFPAVPGAQWLAGRVVQRPSFTSLHAGLMQPGAEHVIVINHGAATQGIGHTMLVALDIEQEPGAVILGIAGPIFAGIDNRQEWPTKRVGVQNGRRARMCERLGRCVFFRASFAARRPRLIPAG